MWSEPLHQPCCVSRSVMSDSAAPWTIPHRAPLSMKFSRQQYWSGLPCPPPRDHPNPGIKSTSLMSAALADRFLTTKFTWEARYIWCIEYDIIFKDEKEMILCVFFFLFRALSLTHPGFPFPCPISATFSWKPQPQSSVDFWPAWNPRVKEGGWPMGQNWPPT